MAIKRPSKSRGTPLRKPMTSVTVRHIEVKAKHQMVPGTVYPGWLCKNKACGLVIAVALPAEGGKPVMSGTDDHITAVKCPHCGNEDLYRWNARGEHPYNPPAAG
ncbi:MAG TPA: hypothetical protein VMD03_11085 [Steroidobacteraceae bacterium]|nr:hypothetical protein [Steroidobacteraceae bacterium]